MTQKNDVLVNRVANSGLITIDLEKYYPQVDFVAFDLKDYLFKGLILKEKDFRQALKDYDWNSVNNKVLCVYCSADAIIPQWAYMLVASKADQALDIHFGNSESWIEKKIIQRIESEDYSEMDQKRIVVKGCGEKGIGPAAYLKIAQRLQPLAQSIMYGEPCSTVPIFKRPRVLNK